MSLLAADQGSQPACSQCQTKLQSRHAKAGIGTGDTLTTNSNQIHPGAEVLPMRQGQGGARRMGQHLQQGFDADKAQYQVPFALLLVVAEVKTGTEIAAFTAQYQQIRLGLFCGLHGRDQGFDQIGRQGIALVRPVQRQCPDFARAVHVQVGTAAAIRLCHGVTPCKMLSLCSPNAGGAIRTGKPTPLIRRGETKVRVSVSVPGRRMFCTHSMCSTCGSRSTSE